MKIEIPEFKEFPDSNISGRMIVNPYWLEHLLNLFFQGYLGEVWEEIMDTEMNHCDLIENWGYGIIGQEFNKKHLDLSNSIVPPSNSPTASSHSFGEHNMRYQENSNEFSQMPNGTSDNANIMFNKLKMLPSDSK